MIKPIETRYKGYRFRSRLEARWAVFFDALGLNWEYEPEGFDLGCLGSYLPDFVLPELGMWVEVKGCASKITEDEADKAQELFRQSGMAVAIVAGKSPSGHLIDGCDRQDVYGLFGLKEGPMKSGYIQAVFCADATHSSGGECLTGFEFALNRDDGLVYVFPDLVADGMRERDFYISLDYDPANRFVSMPDGYIAPHEYSGEKVYLAAQKARSARFEHGERPA